MNTIDRLRRWQKELQEKFLDEDVAYTHVSMTQFSIARHYGSAVINGHTFFYNPIDDTLIRGDVLRYLNKLEKQEKDDANRQLCPQLPCFESD
jgi:hypothetical protein